MSNHLNKYIDHTNLNPTATPKDIIKLCHEAIVNNFYAVCVNSCYVALASNELRNTPIKIAAVVGFPLGANSLETKLFEASNCINNGANEIDMVINLGLLKATEFNAVQAEINAIKKTIGNNVLKVILENCYLTKSEIVIASEISVKAGADFIKTSTGFGTSGATLEDVALMKQTVQNQIKIKASGGIRDYETAKKYIDLGVDRIGTSSGIKIISKE